MRALVLLSQGRHPVSRRAAPVELELQAIGLARSVAWQVVGLHAGPMTDLLAEYGGYGLDFIHRLDAPPEPAALARVIRALEPDLVLAGRRGMGGNDSGLLPYQVAHALGWPIVADITSVAEGADGLALAQFRPHGARRHLNRRGPLLATIHPAAPPPPPFVFARSRTISVNTIPLPDDTAVTVDPPLQERPYKPRPRVILQGSAPATPTVLTDITPEAAAEAILELLERHAVRTG